MGCSTQYLLALEHSTTLRKLCKDGVDFLDDENEAKDREEEPVRRSIELLAQQPGRSPSSIFQSDDVGKEEK